MRFGEILGYRDGKIKVSTSVSGIDNGGVGLTEKGPVIGGNPAIAPSRLPVEKPHATGRRCPHLVICLVLIVCHRLAFKH